MASFYDLDYLIEINEKRLEEYTANYHRVLDKYAVLLIIYSAVSIFLVPLIQHCIDEDITAKAYWISMMLFTVFLLLSIWNFVRLLIPVFVAYPKPPKQYYTDYRTTYETGANMPADQPIIDKKLKATYINELEQGIINNERVFIRKSSFYYKALLLALLSTLPYLVCLAFHFSKKDDKIHKVEIVQPN
jgi:hypothetical protein